MPPAECDAKLMLVVRDFTEEHPDFETFFLVPQKGIVEQKLGEDKKPVYRPAGPTSATSSKANFDQWYRDVPGVNQTLTVELEFVEKDPGVFVYESNAFFPIDGRGLGNGPAGVFNDPGLGSVLGIPTRNFLFTTEAHLRFTYRGGEVFTFRGDDDLWVFVNGELVVDLGGSHLVETGSVSLDTEAIRLRLTPGSTYEMDIFHAERHTTESNYRIETTIDLSCIENLPPPLL